MSLMFPLPPLRVLLWVLKQKTSPVTQMAIYALLPPVCIRVNLCRGGREKTGRLVTDLEATSCLLQPAGLKNKLFYGLASR